ncbi:hypothetical protein ACCUM_1774 [Candidatus Accumulibacter phosphatis]|uniref:Uncharacterized protein n=1 Tax=Candidatus Accumulibacter phosphatis TaxID=327160 RepID=A0A5S4ES88_9PROT|nr:hypothetical protein ACCUM_1774 [Candidatus Accumulibacter phosphatis]
MPQPLLLDDPLLADFAAAFAEWRSTIPRCSRIPKTCGLERRNSPSGTKSPKLPLC